MPEELVVPTLNIAWTYIDNEDYDNAWLYLCRGLELFTDLENAQHSSQLNSLVGRYYMGKNQFDEAELYFQKSIAVVDKENLILIGGEVYSEYSKLLLKVGRYDEAYKAL